MFHSPAPLRFVLNGRWLNLASAPRFARAPDPRCFSIRNDVPFVPLINGPRPRPQLVGVLELRGDGTDRARERERVHAAARRRGRGRRGRGRERERAPVRRLEVDEEAGDEDGGDAGGT